MKTHEDKKLVDFLKAEEGSVPSPPPFELANIQRNLKMSSVDFLPKIFIWVPAAALATLTLSLMFFSLPQEIAQQEEPVTLSRFIWDSYAYAEDFGFESEDL